MANLRAMHWFSYVTTACAIESYIKIPKAFVEMGRPCERRRCCDSDV